ncbi:hypothetical protein [Vibrio phage LP.2]|nr:hypothetical protein [Vibrio phage LP.2]
MIRHSFETSSMMYIGGNESQRGNPIWIIASNHNKESVETNGHVTVVRRRKVNKIRPILG